MQALAPLTAAVAATRAPLAVADRWFLADGRSVVVRPLGPGDAAAEQAFVAGLSPASRYLRFHVGLQRLPPSLLRALTEIDQRLHVALVACTAGGDGDETIVADARYVIGADPREAEFAVAVADDWQGAGLGREMMRRLLLRAADDGLLRLVGRVLWDNRPMLGLTRALGGKATADVGDASALRAVLGVPRSRTAASVVRR